MEPMPTTRIRAEDVLRCDGPWRDHEIWDGLPMVRAPSGGCAEILGARVVAALEAFAVGVEALFAGLG